MRRFRYLWIAVLSFCAVIFGPFMKRAIAVALCAILGFDSSAPFLHDSSRAVAVQNPNLIAQNIDIFRNDGGGSSPPPPPSNDIFRNDGGSNTQQPPVDIFRNDANTPPVSPIDIFSNPATSSPPSNQPGELVPGGSILTNEPCNPTLVVASAQPAKEVVLRGVPETFTELVARINLKGNDELFPTVARRLKNGDVAVAAPLHPTNGPKGGDVVLTLSSGAALCSELNITIEPLKPAPGATQRMFAKEQELADKAYQAFGIDRSILIQDPNNLPEELLPFATVQYLLDHPRNPNSLKAILSGTAPLLEGQKVDLGILDGLVANSDITSILDSLFNQVFESVLVPKNNFLASSKAPTKAGKFKPNKITAKDRQALNTPTIQAVNVRDFVNKKFNTTDPDTLARNCKLYDYGAVKDNELYQTVNYIVPVITTALSIAFPGAGSVVAAGTSIGMLVVNMLLKAMEAWLPYYVTDFSFDIDKSSLDLEDNNTGFWNNVRITTRSRGGEVTLGELIDVILAGIGARTNNPQKLNSLRRNVDESHRILDGAREELFQARQLQQSLSETGASAAAIEAKIATAQSKVITATDRWQNARKALQQEMKSIDRALEKVENIMGKINSLVNGTMNYLGNEVLGKKILPIMPIDYSTVTLYSDRNPSKKYIDVQMRRPAVNLAEQNVYKAVSDGSSDLVIFPKLGSIKGACQTWDPSVKKVNPVNYALRIVVNGKDDEPEEPEQTAQKRDGNLTKGTSYGDPHLITFDGYRYSFQTVGEFILAKSVGGDFQVQTRQVAVPGRDLSLNSAAAMRVGNTKVAFYTKFFPDSDKTNILRVNGQPTTISGGVLELPGGGKIYQQGDRDYLVEWPTGEQVAIHQIQVAGSKYLNVSPHVLSSPGGQFIGLLGDLDGDPGNDLKTRNGNVIPSKSTYGEIKNVVTGIVPIPGIVPLGQIENLVFDQIYKDFGNSWRVSQQESLFDYAPGQTTETFTDTSFPSQYKTLSMLNPQQIQQAEQQCIEAGVEPDLLDGCIFDVGFTGDAGFAQAAANAFQVLDTFQQLIPGGLPIPSPPIPIPGLPF